MRRLFGSVAATATALVLLLGLSAAAATTPASVSKRVGLPVAAMAIDGTRVAYSSDDNGVQVWNVDTGAITQLRRGSGRFTDNPTIRELAVAGQRTAWITLASAGNSQETWARLFIASPAVRAARKVATAFRVDGYSDGGVQLWNGDWLSGLVGSGSVLAVGRWKTTPNADQTGSTISHARLSLIEPGHGALRVVASGPKAIVSAAADAGRIAVLRPDDSVGIYSAKGALLRGILPSSAKELGFGGGRVVLLTRTKTLEVYDAGSGALLHTWPARTTTPYAQPGHLSAYGRIAVYLVDARYLTARLHVLDLATGKEVVLPAHEHLARDAVVGRLGLAYAVNRLYFGVSPPKRTGTLVFVPTSRVLAGIAKGRLP